MANLKNLYSAKFWLLLLLIVTDLRAVEGEWVPTDHIRSRLVSMNEALLASEEQWLAIEVELDEHWHIYWRNPGDSGTRPQITEFKPESWQHSDFYWPYPRSFQIGPLVNFGYEETLYLPFKVKPEAANESNQVEVSLLFKYLVCKEACIPGEAQLNLSLPVIEDSSAPVLSKHATGIRKYLDRNPQKWTRYEIETDLDQIILSTDLKPVLAGQSIKEVEFFPFQNKAIATQGHDYEVVQSRVKLKLVRDDFGQTEGDLGLLLVKLDGPEEKIVALDIAEKKAATQETGKAETSLGMMMIFALVGGIILNLMPCVFPILSIKVLTLLEQSQQKRSKALKHALSYSLGVFICLWTLALSIQLLKQAGESVGWGFQLQSPVFIAGLSVLFFLLAMNFLGLFNPWDAMTRLGNLQSGTSSGLVSSFLSGLLAVIVASPCTAPFMGVSLGYALGQDAVTTWLIFSALGFGFVLPFCILGYWPSLLKFLPKPGAWMETLRQFFAFPLLATVIWLLWVLMQQSSGGGVIELLSLFCLLAFFLWYLHIKKTLELFRKLLIYLLALAGIVAILASIDQQTGSRTQGENSGKVELEDGWQDFMTTDLAQVRKDRPVFVDFTAAWCVSCQVNKIVALRQQSVLEAFAAENYLLLRADWTDYNAEIAEFLAKFNRSGVPLYLMYYPGREEPLILPELLTPDLVKQYIEKNRP